MFKHIPSLGAAALLALGTIALAAPQASAVPAYCSAGQYGNGATAYCYTSASGTQFRAVATCRYYISATGTYAYSNWYGPWRIQGDPLSSIATCGTGYSFYSADAQVQ